MLECPKVIPPAEGDATRELLFLIVIVVSLHEEEWGIAQAKFQPIGIANLWVTPTVRPRGVTIVDRSFKPIIFVGV